MSYPRLVRLLPLAASFALFQVGCGDSTKSSTSASAARAAPPPSASNMAAPSASATTAPPAPKSGKAGKDRIVGKWRLSDATIEKALEETTEEVTKQKTRESMSRFLFEFTADGKSLEWEDGKVKPGGGTWEVVKDDGDKLVIADHDGPNVSELTIAFAGDDQITVVDTKAKKTLELLRAK